MYQISDECKKAINHYSRELYSKAYIDNEEIYEGDIISYEINEGIISGSDFELGGAVASTLEIKINNLHGAYDNLELNGKEIKVLTGILLENNTIEYVQMGVFIIDEAVKDKSVINIEATDKMVALEGYYESKLIFPTSILNVANEICSIAGITLATKQFYNSNYIVDSLPAGITLRDVIHDIAEIAGGFVKINRVGELEIITPGTIVATEINKDRYIDLQIKEGFYIDKLTIVENYFPVDPVPINLNVLPFTSKWQGDFSLDSGDKVRLNDGKGTYETIITKQKITFNGGLRYESECTGLSEQQKSTQQISNTEKTNKRYRSEIKQLANEISQKVSSGDFESYQKIIDEKIESKVTKTEAEHIVSSKIEQSEEKWEATFENSGAYNLIENSTGQGGKNGWNNINGINDKINAWYRIEEKTTTGYYMSINRNNDTSKEIETALSKRFNLEGGQEYSFNGKFITHSNCRIKVSIRTSNTVEVNDEDSVSYDNEFIIYEASKNAWINSKLTFTAEDNVKSGYLYIEHSGFLGSDESLAEYNSVFWADLVLVQGNIIKPWCPHPNEVYNSMITLDGTGITVEEGAIRVKNKTGDIVLEGNDDGDLTFTGTAKSQWGAQYVALDAGGITFQDYQKYEQMLRVGLSYFNANRDMNGVNFALARYGDFIRFSHILKEDLTNGWSSSDTQYNFMDFWSSYQKVGTEEFKKGINVYAPMYINNSGILFNNIDDTTHTSDIKGSTTWNSITNLLGIFGDNGLALGYKSSNNYQSRIVMTEGSHPGTGDQIKSWGTWNGSGYILHNFDVRATALSVSGSKNCIQTTKNYGERLINAYETAEYYFGDLGFCKISEDGECLVYIDDIFLECVNTNAEYHVFTQVYNGLIKSIERYKTYFIVKGDPGTSFSWELKAKRIGYENNRLDTQSIVDNQSESGIEIFSDEDFKVETSEDALVNILTFELEDLLLMEG